MKKTLRLLASAGLYALILIGASSASLFAQPSSVHAQTGAPFVTTWDVSDTLTIPTAAGGTYDYSIDWGDGTSDSNVTGSITHAYEVPDIYTVSISGSFPQMVSGENRDSLLTIESWGSIAWSSMVDAFADASNLQINALDAPDLSSVESLSGMFRGATSMNTSIGHWDIANVTSIASMFEGATSFDQDLSGWNTGNLQMYTFAFRDASAFNSPLNSWDTSSAISMNGMFADASSFNQPIGDWPLPKLIDIRNILHNATSFDQDLSGWNTTSVERMENAFRNAVSFTQDISAWDFSVLTNADNLLSGTRLSGIHYDRLLTKLATSTTQEDITLNAGSSTYCNAEDSRNSLIARGWTIVDKGRDASNCSGQDIQFSTGVSAAIEENNQTPTEIGSLITLPNQPGVFTYSFCSEATLDQALFSLSTDGTIITNTVFDFENPLDENADNVYEFCVRAQGPDGFDLQRILTVAIIDDPNEDPEEATSSDDTQEDAQVLSSSTDKPSTDDPLSKGDVLAAEDEDAGTALAATGVAILLGTVTGIGIVFATAFFSRRSLVQQTLIDTQDSDLLRS